MPAPKAGNGSGGIRCPKGRAKNRASRQSLRFGKNGTRRIGFGKWSGRIMRAGAFPPLERPDHFPEPIPSPVLPKTEALPRRPVFRTSFRTPDAAGTFPAFGAGIELHDALTPGFISSIFDESGLQRTVSGACATPTWRHENASPRPEIL